jgi:hypothetical protein
MAGCWTVIGHSPCFARQALHCTVDDSAEFGSVLGLAPFCQSAACVLNAEPGGIALSFMGSLGVTDFEEESLHDEFFGTAAQPGSACWLQIEVEMLRLDCSNRPGFLQGLSRGSLAV